MQIIALPFDSKYAVVQHSQFQLLNYLKSAVFARQCQCDLSSASCVINSGNYWPLLHPVMCGPACFCPAHFIDVSVPVPGHEARGSPSSLSGQQLGYFGTGRGDKESCQPVPSLKISDTSCQAIWAFWILYLTDGMGVAGSGVSSSLNFTPLGSPEEPGPSSGSVQGGLMSSVSFNWCSLNP